MGILKMEQGFSIGHHSYTYEKKSFMREEKAQSQKRRFGKIYRKGLLREEGGTPFGQNLLRKTLGGVVMVPPKVSLE